MTSPVHTQRATWSGAALPSLADQAGMLLSQVAGFTGVQTIATGLRLGVIATLAEYPEGLTPEELAEVTGFDPFYTAVWCQGACAAAVLDHGADGCYRLTPQMVPLLLDSNSPAYIGALFGLMTRPEVFDRFAERLPTGERLWWDQTSPDWIRAVSGAGRAFYNRLIPAGLERVPGLAAQLGAGARVLELACGAGIGLAKLARAYPMSTFTGLDGDAYVVDMAMETLRRVGLAGVVDLMHSTLEDLDRENAFDVVLINLAMHECCDIERVAARVRRALRPGGCFVVSDFPFPEETPGLRTVPGRIMAGIQCFEAQIDGQLLPTRAYVELLNRHGFRGVDAFDITPLHAVTYGRK